MGKIIIQEYTTKNPISLIGEESGICYGSDTSSAEKNYKRGLQCIKDGHGRTLEYPQVYIVIDQYSARFMRELYTHIAGSPTRLQASTRYIDYGEFDYIIPSSIANNEAASRIYVSTMDKISESFKAIQELNIPKEDIANLLPLGMTSKMVLRTNLRHLIEMSHQRECTRVYWEFRQFMKDLKEALSQYSPEWAEVVELEFKPKCEVSGYCSEKKSCGKKPKI
jgi:thymidylate synthase (FAD)